MGNRLVIFHRAVFVVYLVSSLNLFITQKPPYLLTHGVVFWWFLLPVPVFTGWYAY